MVNVAVIGTGNMGKNHARIYSELKNANLVAVSDINKEEKKTAKKFGCKFYQDYRKMLAGEKIEAVSIVTPTMMHKKVALDCISQDKHVLIEKPIAESIESAKQIISAAKEKNIVLAVGHVERFNPAVKKLKEIIEKKKIGEITSIIARRVGIFPPQIKDANVVLDLAVHDIDIFNYLLERTPKEIYAKAGRALVNRREDHAIVILDYDGIPCLVQVNWITPVKIRNLAVTGTKGYAELNYITQELKIYKTVHEKIHDSFGDFIIKFGLPEESEVRVAKEEPLKLEIMQFLECIEKNKKPLVTGEDGLSALIIAIKAIKSYREEVTVKL